MKKWLYALAALLSCAYLCVSGSGCKGKEDKGNNGQTERPDDNANEEEEGENPSPNILPAPSLVYAQGGIVRWESVENAVKYEYKYGNDGAIQETTNTTLELAEQGWFFVRAVGDGMSYQTGEWKTYHYVAIPKLEVEGVILDKTTGVVSWEKNKYASKYVYKIGENGEIIDCENTGSVTLSIGQTIYFKAIGNGVDFADSDWLALKYTQSGIWEGLPWV